MKKMLLITLLCFCPSMYSMDIKNAALFVTMKLSNKLETSNILEVMNLKSLFNAMKKLPWSVMGSVNAIGGMTLYGLYTETEHDQEDNSDKLEENFRKNEFLSCG